MRSRDPLKHNTRSVFGVDSAMALLATSKGRSSSKRLNRIIRRIAAVCIITGQWPAFFPVPSDMNPADFPSRKKSTSIDQFKRLRRAPTW